jgi:hypothetical protein
MIVCLFVSFIDRCGAEGPCGVSLPKAPRLHRSNIVPLPLSPLSLNKTLEKPSLWKTRERASQFPKIICFPLPPSPLYTTPNIAPSPLAVIIVIQDILVYCFCISMLRYCLLRPSSRDGPTSVAVARYLESRCTPAMLSPLS